MPVSLVIGAALPAVAWTALGWLVGAVFGHIVRKLLAVDAGGALAKPLRGIGPIGIDPPLQTATALAFGLLTVEHGEHLLRLGVYSLYAAILLGLLFVDLRTRFVYDTMAYPALVLAMLLTPVVREGPWWQGAAGALIGGTLFGAFHLIGRLVYRDVTAMGVGDISLAALLGAMVGYDQVLAGLLLASLIGAGLAIFYWVRLRTRRATMPYGPALCLACLALLIGSGWAAVP